MRDATLDSRMLCCGASKVQNGSDLHGSDARVDSIHRPLYSAREEAIPKSILKKGYVRILIYNIVVDLKKMMGTTRVKSVTAEDIGSHGFWNKMFCQRIPCLNS